MSLTVVTRGNFKIVHLVCRISGENYDLVMLLGTIQIESSINDNCKFILLFVTNVRN